MTLPERRPELRIQLRISAVHSGDNSPIVISIPAPEEPLGHKHHVLDQGTKIGYNYPLSGRELEQTGDPLYAIRYLLHKMLHDCVQKAEEAIDEKYRDLAQPNVKRPD